MESVRVKRAPAIKINIKGILEAKIVEEAKEVFLSYNEESITRVNVIGIVVNFNDKDLILGDDSGNIVVRFFESFSLNNINVGDIILVVGRTRDFGGERYISCEILKTLDNADWLVLRKRELEEKNKVFNEKDVSLLKEDIEVVDTGDKKQRLYLKIKELDSGDGVNSFDLGDLFDFDIKETLESLKKQGNIFEVKPSRYKVLE